MPLKDLPLDPGNWDHSGQFSDVHTAFKWGLKPSQFWQLTEEDAQQMGFKSVSELDASFMTAYIRCLTKMESWEIQEANRKAEEASRKAERE